MFENYLLRTRSSKNVVNFTRRILSGDNYHIKIVGSRGGGRSENLGGCTYCHKAKVLPGVGVGGKYTPYTPCTPNSAAPA